MLRFGVTVLPDPPYQRLVDLIVKAESLGFDSGWTYDSPILWQEPYPLITLLASKTSRMRIGMCVTNPVTREPAVTASAHATLQDISDGRIVMGIGRGDSAVRVMGRKPTPIALFEQRLAMIKDFMNGRPVEWEGTEIQLKWAQDKPEIPLYVAAYGPRALGVAGRVGDGVIIQLADPAIIEWTMATARTRGRGGRARSGRAEVPGVRAVEGVRRHRPGARRGALVPGDGRQPRRRHHPRARRDLRHPARAHRLHQGTRRLRLQGPLAGRRRARVLRLRTRSATASA